MKKLLVTLVVLVLILGTIGLVGGPHIKRAMENLNRPEEPPSVRLQSLEVASLTEFVAAPGFVEPHTKVEIASEVSSQILALPFAEGEEVTRGEIVVRLDDTSLKADLEASQARAKADEYRIQMEERRLEGLNNTLRFSQRELERMQSLFETGDVSRKALDEAQERVDDQLTNIETTQFNLSVQEASLAAAQFNIERAQESLDKTVIRAPMDGTIIALHVEVGEQVVGMLSNIGTNIMTVADLSRMILKADVAESDIASIQEEQQADIRINAYPDRVFRGTVTEIAWQRTMSSDGSGVFKAEIELNLDGERIRSGLAANVDIEIDRHEGLVIESQAILERKVEDLPADVREDNPLIDRSKRTTRVVYRFVDGKAVCTPVQTGPSDLTKTIVVRGLNAGDEVVVGPYKVLESLTHDAVLHDESVPVVEKDADGNEMKPDDAAVDDVGDEDDAS